jgi:hypothetical protein
MVMVVFPFPVDPPRVVWVATIRSNHHRKAVDGIDRHNQNTREFYKKHILKPFQNDTLYNPNGMTKQA